MTAMHFYGWEKGLKTGQYYLRSRPARDAIKFTVNMEALIEAAESKDETAILNALEKVKEVEDSSVKDAKIETNGKLTTSVNLGRKSAQPNGGFSQDVKQDTSAKMQKVEAEEEELNPFECENCGS